MDVTQVLSGNTGAAQLHRVADLVPKIFFNLGTKTEDRGDDGNGNTGSDQPVFDRRCPALVRVKTRYKLAERTHHTHQLAPFCPSRCQSNVIRCATSGTSAGGIGYSRSRFGRTQASLSPSFALTVSSHRRHTRLEGRRVGKERR